MTGFAHAQLELPDGRFGIEVRSVNSRFTETLLRLPDEWRALDPVLRARIGRHVLRGKVECRVTWKAAAGGADTLELDEVRLLRLAKLAARVHELVPGLAPAGVADLLAQPGVLVTRLPGTGAGAVAGTGGAAGPAGPDGASGASGSPGASAPADAADPADPADSDDRADSAGPAGPDGAVAPLTLVDAPLDEAFARFDRMREREGARLVDVIDQALERIATQVAALRPAVPLLLEQARERLAARLAEALAQTGTPLSGDETSARIRQEIALLGLKADVVEELDRLDSHVAEMRRALLAGGPVGKRLDFVCQEMNREANTIGSKAAGAAIGDASVALKLHVEQIREQVQNLE